jgi:hypothetical protein
VDAHLPVPRDSRIAVFNGVRLVSSTKEQYETKHKNMELNAYVLAMAIVAAPRQRRNRQAIPEPEFAPFDLRYLRDLPVNTSQPRHIGCQGKPRNNVCETVSA